MVVIPTLHPKMLSTEEEHFLLLSHVCKILLEYAVENSQSQAAGV